MGRFVDRVQALALAMGGPGLFLAAALDSSFISLPEVVDLLLIYMVTQHKTRLLYYAASATAGSVLGCLALYFVGRKGDQWIARRFSKARIEKTQATFQRYGVMAVLIPSLLPPPAPFKIFVLLAGLAGISPSRFTLAVGIGRGIRYFGEALLAYYYGERAMTFLRDNGRTVGLAIAGLLAAGLVAYVVARRTRRAQSPIN
jgi:membrane protein YqaA with SNARE-associated domain